MTTPFPNLAAITGVIATVLVTTAALGADDRPRPVDQRLEVELFAEHPDVVTPVGLAVDQYGRVLVIESHTHFRPDGYGGPPADRILLMEDTDGDRHADRITPFFEGTRHTMNIAVHRDGSVFVATRGEVLRLRDTDDDGRADQRTSVARLETAGNYPHNGLSGFAFDFAGRVYFGFGENLGESYRLVGSDGTALSGEGEGGSVFRCDPDGAGLIRIATGFWNPFHLCIDVFGRLFAVDNDPDARPPCRLLHVVPGGDYGFEFRHGRAGRHPFTAWNGELPGTLPMVSGTGEAPSGVVAYESDGLPGDYRGALLVTSWGDHRIERYRLERRGASFGAAPETVVEGGEYFRPVGIAVAPDGSLFVSDWVDRAYQLHGKGRIWRIGAGEAAEHTPAPREDVAKDPRTAMGSAYRDIRERAAAELARQGNLGRQILRQRVMQAGQPRIRAAALAALAAVGDPEPAYQAAALRDLAPDLRELAVSILPFDAAEFRRLAARDPSPAVRAAALHRLADQQAPPPSDENVPLALEQAADPDPFVRHAAVRVLAGRPTALVRADLTRHDDPRVRLGALLALRRAGTADGARLLGTFLTDPDPKVRLAAAHWVGEQRLETYRDELVRGLARPNLTRELFTMYLAALDAIDGTTDRAGDKTGADHWLARVLLDPKSAEAARRTALRMLPPDHPALTLDRLKDLLEANDPAVRGEAARTLGFRAGSEAQALLASVAADPDQPTGVRATAAAGIVPDSRHTQRLELLITLAGAQDAALRDEALRSLRGAPVSDEQKLALERIAGEDPAAAALVRRVVKPGEPPPRPDPADTDAWLAELSNGGDPAAGERVFFHPRSAGCYRCHQVEGRGGTVGPDLTGIGATMDRRRLLESILQPGLEVAPRWAVWVIETRDGEVRIGGLVEEHLDGDQTYADPNGRLFTVRSADIVSRRWQRASIMPDGLAAALTWQELRDLLAYLSRSGTP